MASGKFWLTLFFFLDEFFVLGVRLSPLSTT
jgi:hypothetical protein